MRFVVVLLALELLVVIGFPLVALILWLLYGATGFYIPIYNMDHFVSAVLVLWVVSFFAGWFTLDVMEG
jgi:hypothetical protein